MISIGRTNFSWKRYSEGIAPSLHTDTSTTLFRSKMRNTTTDTKRTRIIYIYKLQEHRQLHVWSGVQFKGAQQQSLSG